jgi:hypothetical protein
MSGDPLATLDAEARATFSVVAAHLIPAAHDMPSAGDVIDDGRLRFVLDTRPDLIEPLTDALRADLGSDPAVRIQRMESESPEQYGVLTFVVVAGYYTDATVRQLIGYPGQQRIPPDPDEREAYLEEGLIDQVIARGPVWKDPATGRRAEIKETS